jgi:hypothetical protein
LKRTPTRPSLDFQTNVIDTGVPRSAITSESANVTVCLVSELSASS